jgi:branched-chain amino acid transport system substrate-binding protein
MKKLSMKLWIKSLILALMVIALPLTAQAQKVLKIGCNTNFKTKEGIEIRKWHDLITKIVNAQGGWKIGNETYRLEIITDDNGGDATKVRATMEKQIFRDGVKILLDNFLSNEITSAQICEENKVLGLGEGFRAEGAKPDFNYYYRTSGIYFGRAFHYLIYRDYYKRGARTGLFITPEGEQARIQAEQYGAAMTLAGIKPLTPIFYVSDTVDFGPIATKIKSQKPDMVELGGAGGSQAIDIISSLSDVGWKGSISPSSVNKAQLESIVKKVGSYFDGTELLYFDPRGIQKDPEMLKWLDLYTKEYGEFNESGCFWTGGWWILRDAVNNTKSVDVEVLKKYLDKMPRGVMTLTGYSQLFARPDLENYRTIDVAPGHGVGIIKNGKMEYFKQVTVKDQYLVSIKAYNLVDPYKKYWEKYGKPNFPPEKSEFDFADLDK